MAERKRGPADEDERKGVDVKEELSQLAEDFRRDLIEPLQRWWKSAGAPRWGDALARTPRVDLRDAGSNYEVVAELPGIPKGGVELSVEGGRLEIRAQHAEVAAKAAEKVSYYRALTLPADADAPNAKATMRDGVLRVVLPKRRPGDASARRVKVE